MANFACAPGEEGSESGSEANEPITSKVGAIGEVDVLSPISVRFISIAGPSCSAMSTSSARTAIDVFNTATGNSFMKFQFYRHDVIPLAKDTRDELATLADMNPLFDAMGITAAGRERLQAAMNEIGPPSRQWMSRWLTRYRQILMPEQVVAFQGCGGGVEMDTGAWFSSRSNFAHEMGHGFNLSHSFSVRTSNCGSYDLLYAARGRGQPNLFIGSIAQCQGALAQGFTLFRIDPRISDESEGAYRSFSNGIARVQQRRCSSCGEGLWIDQPADDGVERYSTGDWQIQTYARFLNGVPSINAMTYCGASGCPDTGSPGGAFFSGNQVSQMTQWAVDHLWVYYQGKPAPIQTPAEGCAHIMPGEGLGRLQPYSSCDNRFRLMLTADGNLVLQQRGAAAYTTLWQTGPLVDGTDTTDMRLLMQDDGDLVVYTSGGQRLWSSGTRGNPGAYILISNNGNMTLRAANGTTVLWKTGTKPI